MREQDVYIYVSVYGVRLICLNTDFMKNESKQYNEDLCIAEHLRCLSDGIVKNLRETYVFN